MTKTTTTLQELSRCVNELRDHLERLVRLGMTGGTEHDDRWLRDNGEDLGIYDHDGLWGHLWEWPLEVVHHATRHSDGDDWAYSHTVVVFAAGGPHIELDTATDDIIGRWGDDRVIRGVNREVSEFYALED